jgi:acyl-CoA thioesterase-2
MADIPTSPVPLQEDSPAFSELVHLLDLTPDGVDRFLGSSPKDRWQRVFGGQVLGQAMIAAWRTVEGRTCHSLHGYFLRPGDPRVPILYRVERMRDGGSFSLRRVVAQQKGEVILLLAASFHTPEEGLEHQAAMPMVPAPEDLPPEKIWREGAALRLPEEVRPWFLKERPVEIRPVTPADRYSGEIRAASQILWFRAKGDPGGDPALHQAILAYTSDITLLDTSLLPHGRSLFSPDLQLASLDHAMWFHRPFRVDEWLLYVQESPEAAAARSFNRGMLFTREGKLVASVAQEGLVRLRKA